MKVCPYCHQDLPDDSTFCTHCGKSLEDVQEKKTEEKLTKRQRSEQEKQVKQEQLEQAKRNQWTIFGVILFLVGLVVFDGILATVFNSFKMDYKIIFIISTILYMGAIGCGVVSILTDRKSRKENKIPAGNGMLAYAEIVISFYVMLVNIQQILLK